MAPDRSIFSIADILIPILLWLCAEVLYSNETMGAAHGRGP